MSECRHGMNEADCDHCTAPGRASSAATGSRTGHTFALIYAPSLNRVTFLHLNRQGESWKIRHYSSPHRAPTVVAQAGEKSTRIVLDLAQLVIEHELPYEHSRRPTGVSVDDTRYWFDEIAKANARQGIGGES